MLHRVFSYALLLVFGLWNSALSLAAPAAPKPAAPKLVVLLVIDQFRPDYLTRFHSRFLPAKGPGGVGGFRYLTERGAFYPLAEHDTIQCMTGPGHAAAMTGAHPYTNGIPLNFWFDQKKQARVYCAADASVPGIGGDPKKLFAGTSPKNMLGTTVSDEWKNAGLPGKVVSISLKDRSAIFMGGHRPDVVLWHDPDRFRWMSSQRYFADGKLPSWVEEMNAELERESGQKFDWIPEKKATGYADDPFVPDAKYLWGMEPRFPHAMVKGKRRSLYSPYGVEITERIAERAIEKMALGSGKGTDFLLLSLSTHDYLAHGFGPNSKEMEEITVAEDREIAKLLRAIDRRVGLANTLVALTADHGGGHNPEYLAHHKIPSGRIDETQLATELNAKLTKRFGSAPKGQSWVPLVEDFAFYLNHPALEAKGEKARVEAEEILRNHLAAVEGVAHVITANDMLLRRLPPGEIGRRAALSYFPGRSGDVLVIPRAGWIGILDHVTHMTAYSYDRYVPLVLTGRSFKPGRYAHSAKVVDLAPTLSFLLGIVPPTLSEGRVLSEALK